MPNVSQKKIDEEIFYTSKKSKLLQTPVSSTNKTDRHDVAEIFLKVAFNTIALIEALPSQISKGWSQDPLNNKVRYI